MPGEVDANDAFEAIPSRVRAAVIHPGGGEADPGVGSGPAPEDVSPAAVPASGRTPRTAALQDAFAIGCHAQHSVVLVDPFVKESL